MVESLYHFLNFEDKATLSFLHIEYFSRKYVQVQKASNYQTVEIALQPPIRFFVCISEIYLRLKLLHDQMEHPVYTRNFE